MGNCWTRKYTAPRMIREFPYALERLKMEICWLSGRAIKQGSGSNEYGFALRLGENGIRKNG